MSLKCCCRCSGEVVAGCYTRQSESASDRVRRVGVSPEGAWPSSQCREDERYFAAEDVDLASASPFLVAIWEFVPENVQAQLSPYQAVCVPAVDVRKLVWALPLLGTIRRNMESDFEKVCSKWKDTVRHKKRRRSQQELQVDLCNACIQWLAGGQDKRVSPAEGTGSALASVKEVSVRGVRDTRSAESLASCTLGDLLAGHAEENAKEFQNFKTLGLSPDIVTGVISLLEALGGTLRELRAACTTWKIPRKEEGRDLSLEKLKAKFREKVVSIPEDPDIEKNQYGKNIDTPEMLVFLD